MPGKARVLNVFASWCTPCPDEHPHLMAFARTKQLPMIGLNDKDARAAATQWLARHVNVTSDIIIQRIVPRLKELHG
jgi:cytochrome c biogenesis protein CcmG/thiol:disulfide interchange protein DsbE